MLNKILAASLLASALFSSAVFAEGAGVDCSRINGSMTIQGYGKVQANPDEAVLNFTSSDINKDAKEAQSECEKKTLSFVNALKSLGINKDCIESGSISLEPRYEYDKKQQKQILTGYRAERAVLVRTGKFELIAQITQQAVNSGIDEINGFNYRIKDESALRKQADQLAMNDAQDQARRLATGFDIKVLKPCQLSFSNNRHQDNGPRPVMMSARLMAANDEGADNAAEYTHGKMTVESYVNVVFAFE